MKRRAGPVRVVLLAPTLAPAGGLCRWSRELVRSLEMVTEPEELTIDVLVRSSMDRARQTVEQYGLRCGLHQMPAGAGRPRERIASVSRVGHLMRDLQPDVVHVPLSWLWLVADRRYSRPHIVATAHAAPSPETVHQVDRVLARVLAARHRITLVVNAPSLRPSLDTLVRVRQGTAISLPVGTDPIRSTPGDSDWVDLHGELGIQPGEAVVISLSRLVPGKRVDLVFDVIDLARRDDLAIRFVICGDGPSLGPLVEQAERRGMQGWVHFLGHVPDPGRLLVQSDAMLSTSVSETTHLAVIEALLAGTPVVATAAGGTVDTLDDERDGRIVPLADTEALYHALVATLRAEAGPLSATGAARTRRRIERTKRAEDRFGLEAMGRAHRELILGTPQMLRSLDEDL